MTAPTMLEIVEELSYSYDSDGVALYLALRSKQWDGERAIDLCRTAEGRERVFDRAHSLAVGAFA